jgi:uncharacterized protein YkwD
VSGSGYGKRRRSRPYYPLRWLLVPACLLTTLAAACGVPISASDLTSTPQSQAGVEIVAGVRGDPGPAVTAVSSLGSGVSANLTSTPLASGAARAVTVTVTPTALATETPTPSGAGSATVEPAATSTTSVTLPVDALKALNDLRTSRGLKPLQLNASLTVAAASYAKLMADKSWFTCGCDPHTGPDGSQPDRRVSAGGYKGLFRGETLAAGQTSGAAVVGAWLTSPAHANIILDPTAVDVGLGYAYNPGDPYRHYWVLETGIP